MSVRHPLRQQAFTLLELVLVILIISIMGLIAIDRLLEYRVDAERAMIKTVIGNLRSSLGMEIAKRVARDRIGSINDLAYSNPMELLAQPPEDYIGEIADENQVNRKGVWYFNTSESALIYKIRFADYFHTALTGPPRIRHQIRLVYTDKNQNGHFDHGIDSVSGLNLVPMEDYQWEFPNE